MRFAGPRLFKPKNHFAAHFPVDIQNFGPVRHYWCMRFEALNQLFKAFAMGGAFRNTCGRCANFWVLKLAIERYFNSQTAYGIARPLQVSGMLRFNKGAHTSCATVRAVLNRLFSYERKRASLELQWVQKLLLRGFELFAGESWLSIVLDGQRILAFIPRNGIFIYKKAIYLALQQYPTECKDSEYGLPVTMVPDGFEPQWKFVAVRSPKLQKLVPLWLTQKKACGEQGKQYRFVPLL